MVGFILRRFFSGVVLVFVVSILTFFLVHGGSSTAVARNLLGDSATEEQVAAKTHELGLDQPLLTQLFTWLGHAMTGNLGSSYFSGQSVTSTLLLATPVTLSVVLGGVLLTALFSVVLGMTAAVKGGWIDRFVQVLSISGHAVPNYWLALMLVLWLAVGTRLFPPTGYISPQTSFVGWLSTIALPVIALAIGCIAAATQQIRGAAIDILESDFIRTLRSRGLSSRSVLLKHVLKNAAPPALIVISLQFIGLLSGAIVIEKVFALPGLGTAAVNGTVTGDVPVVLGAVIVMVILVVIVNLLIDLAAGWLNPKVRV